MIHHTKRDLAQLQCYAITATEERTVYQARSKKIQVHHLHARLTLYVKALHTTLNRLLNDELNPKKRVNSLPYQQITLYIEVSLEIRNDSLCTDKTLEIVPWRQKHSPLRHLANHRFGASQMKKNYTTSFKTNEGYAQFSNLSTTSGPISETLSLHGQEQVHQNWKGWHTLRCHTLMYYTNDETPKFILEQRYRPQRPQNNI